MTTHAVLVILAFLQPAQDDGDEPRTGIAAQVNDEIITWDEVHKRLKKLQNPTKSDRKRILRDLAERLLLKQKAREYNLRITDEKVTETIEREIKRMGGKEKLDSWLRFNQMTYTQYRERVREEILINRLYNLIGVEALHGKGEGPVIIQDVSPGEIREYYRKHRDRFRSYSSVSVQRIGVRFSNDTDKRYKSKLMESLRRRLLEGYDFNILAHYYSDVHWTHDGTAEGRKVYRIADLQRDNDMFTPETTALIFDVLKVKELSPIVEDGNTLNLFMVESRTEQREIPFEEAQVKIRTHLRARQQDKYKRLILAYLIEHAFCKPGDLFGDLRKK